MRIILEQNSGRDSDTIPYFANVEIASITVDFNTRFQIPINLRMNGTATYVANVCGFQCAGDSLAAVVALIEGLLPQLVNMARFPTYVFIARRSHKMYPVYTYGDQVFATTPGGPLFEHVELAKVREFLSDYLHTIGELGAPNKSEALHVRGVHRRTLGLVRPIFYLKKRPETDNDFEFWAPVFPSKDHDAIYTYAASGRREVDIDNGHEILRLRSQVAQALMADRRLQDDYDLRVDRLLPRYWKNVEPHLEPTSSRLIFNGSQLSIYKEGQYLVGVEHRQREDRYSFYIGDGAEALQKRAAADLVRRGLVSDVKNVRLEA